MLFNSYLFIFIFLPLSLIGYFSIAKKSPRGAMLWLVLSSLVFYSWWNIHFVSILLLSIGVNYSLGLQLMSPRATQRRKKWLLIAGLVFNLGLIGYFKYAHFIVTNVNILASTHFSLEAIALPLAISFFTFQQIAYLVDTYRGINQEANLLKYSLFITFFPQLIAGPIVHHQPMMSQFALKRIFQLSHKNIAIGSTLFLIGLFKKVVLADHLSLYATPVFTALNQGEILTIWEAWGGSLAYTFQLYFDFSGYTDMALGLGWLFGIKLPQNFHSPYQAKNIIDFWRRWHITLSNFLRDYLYIPLGGNRLGATRRYVNLGLTMLIGGLWHGAGWTFVIWGALHGAYLIINHAWLNVSAKLSKGVLYSLFAQGLTFVCVLVAWIFFRAANFSDAISMLKSLFFINGISLPQALEHQLPGLFTSQAWISFDGLFSNNLCHWPQGMIWIIIAMVVAFAMPNSGQLLRRYQTVLATPATFAWQWAPNKRWASVMIVIALLSLLNLGQMSEFLYFQF